jgi:hypothetical protein
MKPLFTLATIAMTAFSLNAFALTNADLIGKQAADAMPTRSITIDSQTHYINVKQSDVVKFSSGSDNAVWLFDGLNSVVPLSNILPAVPNADSINVYVDIKKNG